MGEIGLWAPLQISSSRETASGSATHGRSTQTFNIVLDLSTGKLNPIIRVSEVNKIILTGTFQSCLGMRGIWSNCCQLGELEYQLLHNETLRSPAAVDYLVITMQWHKHQGGHNFIQH